MVVARLCVDSAFEVLRGLCDEESRENEEMLWRRQWSKRVQGMCGKRGGEEVTVAGRTSLVRMLKPAE